MGLSSMIINKSSPLVFQTCHPVPSNLPCGTMKLVLKGEMKAPRTHKGLLKFTGKISRTGSKNMTKERFSTRISQYYNWYHRSQTILKLSHLTLSSLAE